MSLSPKTIEVLKASVPLLESQGVTITGRFYCNMFRDNPQLRDMFNVSHIPHLRGDCGPEDSPQAISLAHSVLAYASNADNLGGLTDALETIAEKHVAFFVRPDQYPIVRKNLLGSIKTQLGNGATDEIMGAWEEAYDFLAEVLIKMEKDRFEEKENAKGGWRETRQFVVESKKDDTTSGIIKSFCLKPKDGNAVSDYKPGQYITLKIPRGTSGCPASAEHDLTRNYSLSTAANANGDQLNISVKKEGAVSEYLHDEIQPGDCLNVGPPCGTFTLPACVKAGNDFELVFIAAGVGITSTKSMLEAALARRRSDGKRVTLVQCCRTDAEHPMREQVNEMAKKTGMKAIVFYSRMKSAQDDGLIKAKTGHINSKELKKLVDDPKRAQFFFCGPKQFMLDIRQILQKEMGAPAENLHFEYYGPTPFMA